MDDGDESSCDALVIDAREDEGERVEEERLVDKKVAGADKEQGKKSAQAVIQNVVRLLTNSCLKMYTTSGKTGNVVPDTAFTKNF